MALGFYSRIGLHRICHNAGSALSKRLTTGHNNGTPRDASLFLNGYCSWCSAQG